MESTDSDPLKHAREVLRSPIADIGTFITLLQNTYESTANTADRSDTLQSLRRHLAPIQLSLIYTHIPVFLHALDEGQKVLLRSFFLPPPAPSPKLRTFRICVAVCAWMSIPPLLSQTSPSTTNMPPPPQACRQFILDVTNDLVVQVPLADIYATMWPYDDEGESSRDASLRNLQWERLVTSLMGLPEKTVNSVHRWEGEGWKGSVPANLSSDRYFETLFASLASLLEVVSEPQVPTAPYTFLLQKIAARGLFTAPKCPISFWRTFLPRVLARCSDDKNQPFPILNSFPSMISALPASNMYTVNRTLLLHLAHRITNLAPSRPEETIKRAAIVLGCIQGKATAGGEAMNTVLRCLLEADLHLDSPSKQALIRIVIAWLGQSTDKVIVTFLRSMITVWTDPKQISYAQYSRQLGLTYAVIMCVSLLPLFHPDIIAISRQGRFLTSMQAYIGNPDPSVRRLGLLVAEIVSDRTVQESSSDLEYSEKDEIESLKAGLEGEDTQPRPSRGIKKLNFGAQMWEDVGEGREEARWLRSAVGVRDNDAVLTDDASLWLVGWDKPEEKAALSLPSTSPDAPARGRKPVKDDKKTRKPKSKPKIVMLDEEQSADKLEGYDVPSPSSSRSPSPTPSFLEEVKADPSLALGAVGEKKVQRPVYISQLIALVKEREKPDHIEMAFRHGQALVRAKRNFGGELEENAVQLASMVVVLNDPFDIEDFDENRQGILNALVACAPTVVAPYLAELYFTAQFSLHQRSVVLTALAMGARELAGMTLPLAATCKTVDFPSKTLTPALHRKYAIEGDFQGQLEAAVDGVRGLLLSKSAQKGQETHPELARQKQLRMTGPGGNKRTLIAERGSLAERQMNEQDQIARTSVHAPVVPYKDVAAEYFIMPLINRFWTYFQDSSTREVRAKVRGDRYRGAGTGMILSPMAVEKFLMTLVLLLHAARHSSLYLAILAPESLELSVTLAHHYRRPPLALDAEEGEDGEAAESGVVGSALELSMVVLDASYEQDGGRTLAFSKPALLSSVGEWASGLFKMTENGERLSGQAGIREGRVRSGAAGVFVKVSEIAEKWGKLSVV